MDVKERQVGGSEEKILMAHGPWPRAWGLWRRTRFEGVIPQGCDRREGADEGRAGPSLPSTRRPGWNLAYGLMVGRRRGLPGPEPQTFAGGERLNAQGAQGVGTAARSARRRIAQPGPRRTYDSRSAQPVEEAMSRARSAYSWLAMRAGL